MADLLASQDKKQLTLSRGQEIEGTIVSITDTELILDLGTKAEGIIHVKDLSPEQAINLKVGDKLKSFVLLPENESGQAVLTFARSGRGAATNPKWAKFQDAKDKAQTLTGKGLEVNKGGLIVELSGMRGFLPSSQVNLSQAANLDAMIGQDVEVEVIEVDPNQNRLILAQKTKVDDTLKQKISQLKTGSTVAGTVAAVLPFGVFVTLENGVEGLVHVSELSWERMENPGDVYTVGDSVEAKVINADPATGRVNLSIKQLTEDPFTKLAEDFQPDDVVKGTVTKLSSQGVNVSLKDGVEGFIPAAKIDPSVTFEVGQSTNFLVDTIDSSRRRINLAPFLTSTEGLIYK